MWEIRHATAADLPHIQQWRRDAAAWLAGKGSDQWSDTGLSMAEFTRRVVQSITAGETWLAVIDSSPRGTIAVDEHTDDGLWTPSELGECVVVHRMITDRLHRVPGLGAALLDVADARARDLGKPYVRLDAWTSNTGLHDYYRNQGFELVRTVAGRPSGALFQRAVQPAPDVGDTPDGEPQQVAATNLR